jgi:hypothetical protein
VKKEEISEILNNIDTEYIEEAEDYTKNREYGKEKISAGATHHPAAAKPRFRFRWAFAAAALVLFIAAGSVFFAVRAEAKEYNEAMDFFKSNGLSTEGLNRAEIKAIYRDITTKSFTYGKTAEVITNSIPGYAVDTDSLSPEDLALIWEKNSGHESSDIYGCSYKIDYRYQTPEIQADITESIVSCVKSGKVLWETVFPNLSIQQCITVENGTIAFGSTNYDYSADIFPTVYIAQLDNKGAVKWEYKADHGFRFEDGVGVFPKEDGTTAVFTSGFSRQENAKHLCFLKLDRDGKEYDFTDILHGEYGFNNAAQLGDDYLVQIGEWWNTDTDANARLLKIDSNGNLLGEYSYTADNCRYYITDMIEFGERLYISAYAVPLKDGASGETYLNFDDLHRYLEETYDLAPGSPATHEVEITEFIKKHSTAVLLLCDPGSASPQLFYSVKGAAVGNGSLSVNESNELEWSIKSIEYITHHPLLSTTLGIRSDNCKSVKYCFNDSGDLLRIIDTGESVHLYR